MTTSAPTTSNNKSNSPNTAVISSSKIETSSIALTAVANPNSPSAGNTLTITSKATSTSTSSALPTQQSATVCMTGSTTRTMQSDEDFNIRFVNLVRQHRCLYDKKVPEYRNRDNQEKAWSLISQETRESVIHCKERWRNLRACLSRYIKQQSGTDPQHKPYYLTEHMAFLLPFLKSTRNSLDGNNSLAQLYQYSQQQLHNEQLSTSTSLHVLTQSNLANFGANGEQQQIEMKHSLSENDDEETIDAFDPAVTASLQLHHNNSSTRSPPFSDTASANTFQNYIPDIQLSELQSADEVQDVPFSSAKHHTHGVTIVRRGSHEFGQHQPVKRIKTECHASEATTTGQLAMYNCDNTDMEFFRSILPDIAALTPQQKRKFKIGILELIDDVIERFPADRTTNTATNSSSSSHGSKQRCNSARDWQR